MARQHIHRGAQWLTSPSTGRQNAAHFGSLRCAPAPVTSNVRPMTITQDQLQSESERATELLRGKIVEFIVRHRGTEVLVQFSDGSRLFVDESAGGLELSITGGDAE